MITKIVVGVLVLLVAFGGIVSISIRAEPTGQSLLRAHSVA